MYTFNSGETTFENVGALHHIGASEFLGGQRGCQKLKDAGATNIVFLDTTGGTNAGVTARANGCFTVFTGLYLCFKFVFFACMWSILL